MKYDDMFSHFLSRPIYGLETDAAGEIPLIYRAFRECGWSEENCGRFLSTLTALALTNFDNKDKTFLKRIYEQNRLNVNTDNFNSSSKRDALGFRDNVLELIANAKLNHDVALDIYVSVYYIACACVKGYLTSDEKEYYTKLRDDWMNYCQELI